MTIDTAPYPLVPEIRYLLSYSGSDKLPKSDIKDLEELNRRLTHAEITQLIDRSIAIFSQRGQPLSTLTFGFVKKLAFHTSHRAPPQTKQSPTASNLRAGRVTSESYNSMMADTDEYLKEHKVSKAVWWFAAVMTCATSMVGVHTIARGDDIPILSQIVLAVYHVVSFAIHSWGVTPRNDKSEETKPQS